jgi:hypothetical protein
VGGGGVDPGLRDSKRKVVYVAIRCRVKWEASVFLD